MYGMKRLLYKYGIIIIIDLIRSWHHNVQVDEGYPGSLQKCANILFQVNIQNSILIIGKYTEQQKKLYIMCIYYNRYISILTKTTTAKTVFDFKWFDEILFKSSRE